MKEFVPQQRSETIRQELVGLLEAGALPASALSQAIGLSEKDIYDHLDQIKRAGRLTIIPAECAGCGFVFKERRKPKKPGKCPECKSTRISPPLFSVKPG